MREITVIPWHCDFFAALAALIAEQTPDALAGGDLSEYLVVFPHLRPKRYLLRALRNLPQVTGPCRPPEIVSAARLFADLRIALENGPLAEAPHKVLQRLDRVAVLRESVAALERESGPLARLPVSDPTLFIPWGLRLESLLEEFARQDLRPQNIPYTEEHVRPFAAALLSQLGVIAADYETRLAEQGCTTPARDARRVVRHLDVACAHLEGRRVVLAGFSDIGALEEKLFSALWRRGALMVLHTDPAPCSGHAPHWSCREHEALIARWGAAPRCFMAPGQEEKTPALDFRCHEGFDLHSQLDAMQRELLAPRDTEGDSAGKHRDVTIVLPNTGLLMPVLHHLPDKNNVNVSMGYPLSRSPLVRLVDCLLRLQETARGPGRYYWKDLLECLRHPYLKMLTLPPNGDGDDPPGLRPVFHALESSIRSGQAYCRPLEWEPLPETGGWSGLAGDSAEALRALFQEVLETCLRAWEEVDSLAGAAQALHRLCDLLRRHGAPFWRRFPIDAECLHRLLYNVIPTLGQSTLATTRLPRETVFAILRQAMEDERTPFEAESLEGLQLLGLLETRLLTPETLFILDATDDVLPGAPANDPLLPDALRRLVGLPDSRDKERAVAHYFFRLLHGARDIVLFYQTSLEGGGLLDEKRLPSRFVQELLWKREQKLGHVLSPGEPPVATMGYVVSPPRRARRVIVKGGEVQNALEELLRKGLSPSSLDDYLHCPAQFFYKRVCKIQAPQEVVEEGDPLEIGQLVHLALEVYFRERLNTPLHGGTLDPQALSDAYLQLLRAQPFYGRIPFDQRLMLEKTGPILLRDYLEHMAPTTVLALETELEGRISLAGHNGTGIPLRGKIDRVDKREHGVVVLDYKTGYVATPGKSFWRDDALWRRLRSWPDCERPEELLAELAREAKSLQLPCYCHLHRQHRGLTPWDAALVELRDKGKEYTLFDKKSEAGERTEAVEVLMPELLAFVVRHMLKSESFAPCENERCQRCDYAVSCGAGAEVS